MRRVLKGAGFRDPAFSYDLWYRRKTGRNVHLDTMGRVDKSGNLDYLSLYILRLLELSYKPNGVRSDIFQEIKNVEAKKQANIASQKFPTSIGLIWDKFTQLGIADTSDFSNYELAQAAKK